MDSLVSTMSLSGRSPYGERGLKCRIREAWRILARSLSLRRAWIEIFCFAKHAMLIQVALLTESVD